MTTREMYVWLDDEMCFQIIADEGWEPRAGVTTAYLSHAFEGILCHAQLVGRSILQPLQKFQQSKVLLQTPHTRVPWKTQSIKSIHSSSNHSHISQRRWTKSLQVNK